jgi:hypothetical protein
LAVVVALADPLSVTVAPLPAEGGLIVPEILQVGCTGRIDTVFPVVDVVSAVPSTEADTPLESDIDDDVSSVDAEIVSATVATTPFEIVVELSPDTRHIEVPAVLVQETCLPAAVPAAPIVTAAEVKSTVEYPRVHCNAAGAVPVLVSKMLRLTVPPGLPEPEDTLNATPCARAVEDTSNAKIAICIQLRRINVRRQTDMGETFDSSGDQNSTFYFEY